jgi:hypothetical protein
MPAEVDTNMKSGSAHRLDVVVLSVALLDGTQLVGKRCNLFWLGQHNPRQDSHPDCVIGSGLRIGGLDVPGPRVSNLCIGDRHRRPRRASIQPNVIAGVDFEAFARS